MIYLSPEGVVLSFFSLLVGILVLTVVGTLRVGGGIPMLPQCLD